MSPLGWPACIVYCQQPLTNQRPGDRTLATRHVQAENNTDTELCLARPGHCPSVTSLESGPSTEQQLKYFYDINLPWRIFHCDTLIVTSFIKEQLSENFWHMSWDSFLCFMCDIITLLCFRVTVRGREIRPVAAVRCQPQVWLRTSLSWTRCWLTSAARRNSDNNNNNNIRITTVGQWTTPPRVILPGEGECL